ncbi:MAG TPA: hypothetical protein VNA86_01590 [bacterium]|nr:hypothetical protein [bacterium]
MGRVTNSLKSLLRRMLPSAAARPATISLAEVRCRKRLGGLLKHYSRAA